MSARLLEQPQEQHDKINSKYIRLNAQVALWVVEPQNPEFPVEMDGSLGMKQLFPVPGTFGMSPTWILDFWKGDLTLSSQQRDSHPFLSHLCLQSLWK